MEKEEYGSYTNKIIVKRAKNISDVIDIRAGKNHVIALKSNGEVYASGSNLYGELGQDNTKVRRTNEFTKIEGLENVCMIGAGDSHNIALKNDGSIYTWGSNIYKELGINTNSSYVVTPTKVPNLKDIRYVDGGRGYSLALDKNGNTYVCGQNTTGELGNNSKTNIETFEKLTTIENVKQLTGGNTYTNFLKTDGTVWGTGDYAHGDEAIKSLTKGIYPIQVGNGEIGFEEIEIAVKVNESKDISVESTEEFNLIYLNKNFDEKLNYTSLNTEIATVDNTGMVTGRRVGTTRVTAISELNGKKYSLLIKVIKEDSKVAPKIVAGENFAVVLKADGSIWTFGYNGDGRLGLGNNLTKEIPNKTDIISTYKDIKLGKDFAIGLRDDGTVWAVGNNKKGQLGDKTNKSRNKFSQIPELENIEKVAAGSDFGIAIDNYGIVYEWGKDVTSPKAVDRVNQRIIDIAAGFNQSIFITSKGTVIGAGDILEGELDGIDNAVKVQVLQDKIIILTTEYKAYEYQKGKLTEVHIPEKVIDISAKNTSVMYQTEREKTYVSGENTYGELGVGNTNAVTTPTLIANNEKGTYGIGVGYNNTYIIENTGNVYASRT